METTDKQSVKYLTCIANKPVNLMCGLFVFLFASCTENVIDPSHSGKKVDLQFVLGDVVYNGNEVVTRNQSDMTPETVEVPIGNGLKMYATLETDHDSVKTRTATSSNLADGTKLRIVAYRNGNTYYDHADYTVSGTDPNATLTGGSLWVEPGNYRFVAYSYNSKTVLPAPHSETIPDIDPVNDVLWGKFPEDNSTYTVNDNTKETVTITMSHKLSQVTVQTTTVDIPGSVNITHIANVTVPGKSVNLATNDGSLSLKNDVVQNIGGWSAVPSTTVSSTPRTVYTGGAASTVVQIGSVYLSGGYHFTNLTAVFNKQLVSGISYTIRVHFKKDPGGEIPFDTPPTDMLMYVGAFWKHDQTGERLIRIMRPSSGKADGAWTATVLVGNDWIVLDKEMTTDPNVGWRSGATEAQVHNGNDPGFDNLHPVNSTLTTVSGTLSAAEPIYFRIGLKSTLPNYPAVPARYGVVLLTYKNNSLRYRIWIRQGEGADYLMKNGDPVNSGGINSRTKCVPFMPYNLSAKKLDDHVDIPGTTPEKNPGRFADYPTQTGALFHWANIYTGTQFGGGIRWAWNPHENTRHIWGPPKPGYYWDNLKANHETCPPGYRRPTDGSTTADEQASKINVSELRQSLFRNPKTGWNYANDVDNSTWGYYADGFFDRRSITGNTTVASGSKDVAYIGRLFFNTIESSDHCNASLFFPASGRLHPVDGSLAGTGTEGLYWMSTMAELSKSRAAALRVFYQNGNPPANHAGPWQTETETAAPIRCVRE